MLSARIVLIVVAVNISRNTMLSARILLIVSAIFIRPNAMLSARIITDSKCYYH